MTKTEYDQILRDIYENGRVIEDDDHGAASEDAEFHFEAKQRGHSDTEIASARARFA